MIEIGVLAVVAVLIGIVVAMTEKYRSRRERDKRRRQRARAVKDREARREAHYMRNFWSYDGSGQEEFEE